MATKLDPNRIYFLPMSDDVVVVDDFGFPFWQGELWAALHVRDHGDSSPWFPTGRFIDFREQYGYAVLEFLADAEPPTVTS